MLFKTTHTLSKTVVNPQRGFTIAELVVVCGIIGVITAVVLAGYSRYSSQSLLQSLMYEMAISVREAQIFGSAVKSQSANFDVSYGIQFTTDNNGSQYFIVSRPLSTNTITPISTFTISRGNRVTNIYGCEIGWAALSSCTERSSVFLYFKRPHFDTAMEFNSGGPGNVDDLSDEFVIIVTGPTGTRELHLYRSGRVAIR